ncbi:hypothetical protein Tco_0991025, partial [Tanacetum coccineum]
KMKVIKEESKALGLLMIDDDLSTCDAPLGTIFNAFNRLSIMDDDLFTYEVKIIKLSYFPIIEQQMDDFDNGNLDVYERKLCYDEYLKYGDHTMESNEVKESVIATLFIRSYKKQFDEYVEIKKQMKVYGLDVGMEYDPSNVDFDEWFASKFTFKEFNYLLKIDVDVLTNDIPGFKTYDNYKDHGYMNGTKTFHGWLICHGWIMDLGWNLATILNIFANRVASRMDMLNGPLAIGKWKNIAMGELKDETLKSKEIFEISKGVDEEPSDNTRTHHSPSDEWEDFEHANHIGANTNSNYNLYLDVSRIFNDHARINNDYKTRKDEGQFDEQELIGDDDDDIRDLEDYLIQKDPPYYVNEEEEERSKEQRCKLLRIPYVRPPTCKSEMFEEPSGRLNDYGHQLIRRIHQLDTTYRPFHSEQRIDLYSLNNISFLPNNTAYSVNSIWPTDLQQNIRRQYLKELRKNTFSGSEHEDANEHIEKVLEIFDLFHIPEILNSKGVIPTKTVADAKIAIQEMVEYSHKWHNGTSLKTKSTETSDGLAAIQALLNNLGRERLRKSMRKYTLLRAAGARFYQCNNENSSYPDRRQTLKEPLTKFMVESAKRHEENSNIIKEIRASTDAAIRNQGASIKTLEIQIGQMSKVLQERGKGGLPGSTEPNPRDHVKSISTAKADSSEIRRMGCSPYAVSGSQHRSIFSKTVPFLRRLQNYCCDEWRKGQDMKILETYDHTFPQKEKDQGALLYFFYS